MIYTGLQKALEKDFAKMDLSPAREITLRFDVQTEDLLETGRKCSSQQKLNLQ